MSPQYEQLRELLIDESRSAIEQQRELTYLPLAITQAAGYLERNEASIAAHPRLLRNTEKYMVDLLSEELQDRAQYKESKNTVETT